MYVSIHICTYVYIYMVVACHINHGSCPLRSLCRDVRGSTVLPPAGSWRSCSPGVTWGMPTRCRCPSKLLRALISNRHNVVGSTLTLTPKSLQHNGPKPLATAQRQLIYTLWGSRYVYIHTCMCIYVYMFASFICLFTLHYI